MAASTSSVERVAQDQPARLRAAMVEAVARHGYPVTTVGELVGLAAVSKSTFYQHFENKQECFLAAFEEIVDRLSERVAAAYRRPGSPRGRLRGALEVFMTAAVEEPAAVSLVVVDSLTLGAAGFERRERASRRFEVLLERSMRGSRTAVAMPELTARVVIGGVRGVAYRRLRAGDQAELPGLVEELVDWALSCERPRRELTRRAVEAARPPAAPSPPRDDSIPGWDEPPDSQRSRRTLSQRERLVRGAARIAFERGYGALSIPAISSAAGVSNQTFYEHFPSKRDAFLAAFDLLAEDALAATAAAVSRVGDRPEALGAGIRAMLEHIATNELFAKIAFFELPVAGPVALDRGDAVLGGFTAFLKPELALAEFERELSPLALEAIGSGIWALLVFEIYRGRREGLAELAPELTRLALTPIDVS